MTTPTHDLAIARAERDAWQSTCEELHRAIAGRDVEIESHLGRCEAADQRARSLEAGLAHVNGNIMECRAELRAIRDLVAPGNPQGTVVDAVRAMIARWSADERDLRAAIARAEKAEAEIAGALSGLAERLPVTPPTLAAAVDAVREAWDADRSAGARSAAETTTALVTADRELAKLRAELAELTITRDRLLAREHEDGRLHAQLRAELAELRAPKKHPSAPDRCPKCEWTNVGLVNFGAPGVPLWLCHGCAARTIAELRARPVLTVEALDAAAESCGYGSAVIPGFAAQMFAALGPATLPSPDRAEELCRAYHDRMSIDGKPPAPAWNEFSAEARVTRVTAMRLELAALAKLSPAPVRGVAPTHVCGQCQKPAPSPAATCRDHEWIGVDLDGTLAHHDTWRGLEHIGDPVPAMLDRVRAWLDAGVGVRILTARVSDPAEGEKARAIVKQWCRRHLGRALPVTCVKDMHMTELWDDRAVAVRKNTGHPVTVAPTLVAVSDEELATAYSVAHDQPIPRMAPLRDRTIAGIRAVRAKFGAAEVTEERVKAALCEHFKYEGHRDWSADARAILAYLRATAAKGG